MTPLVFWPDSTRILDRFPFLETLFPKSEYEWIETFRVIPEGAVIIINGGAESISGRNMRQFNEDIHNFKWAAVLSLCDEGSGQRLDWLNHPKLKIWVQDPKPGKHDKWYRLPSGQLCAQDVLSKYENAERSLDWVFSGSVKSPEWDLAIRRLPRDNAKYHMGHVGHEEYIQNLSMAKMTLCRPCWAGPETCRVYDALEAGCVPIVGYIPGSPRAHWIEDGHDWPRYWEFVLGEKPPFPVIEDPKEDLARVVAETIATWTPERPQMLKAWWNNHKQKLRTMFREEIQKLQR